MFGRYGYRPFPVVYRRRRSFLLLVRPASEPDARGAPPSYRRASKSASDGSAVWHGSAALNRAGTVVDVDVGVDGRARGRAGSTSATPQSDGSTAPCLARWWNCTVPSRETKRTGAGASPADRDDGPTQAIETGTVHREDRGGGHRRRPQHSVFLRPGPSEIRRRDPYSVRKGTCVTRLRRSLLESLAARSCSHRSLCRDFDFTPCGVFPTVPAVDGTPDPPSFSPWELPSRPRQDRTIR